MLFRKIATIYSTQHINANNVRVMCLLTTGLFISRSGISELDCAIFRHDYPLAVEPASTPSTKKTWRDSPPIDMLLSAVSVLVVPPSSTEIPEGFMNNPVFYMLKRYASDSTTRCAFVHVHIRIN
jgi:hypothetical protein